MSKNSWAIGDQKYNGWSNYETWNVALWIDSDENTYHTVKENAPFTAVKAQRIALELYPKGTPDMDSPADMDRVNWKEIARAWNE
jgi:hypothetical protein